MRARMRARSLPPRRSPLVRRRLQECFGREITVNYDPELAIVSGNALYARFVALKH